MWAYVLYSNGKNNKTVYIEKSFLIKITGVEKKYIINKNNGKYYEGIILAEGESKEKLKALVSSKKFQLEKHYFQVSSAEMQLPVDHTESLFKADDCKINWKKRLITLATGDNGINKSLITENTTPQANELIQTLTNETQVKKCQKSPICAKPDRTSASVRIKKVQMSSNREHNSMKRSTKSVADSTQCENIDSRFKEIMNEKSKPKRRLKNKLNQEQAKEECKVMPKRRKLNDSSCTKNDPNTKESSTLKKYVQFCITHVYSPVPYSKALKNILHENGVNETMEVLDSSVIEFMSSNAPLLHSSANITIFNSNQMPKEESFNAGVNYDLFKLKEKFEEFKYQAIALLTENNNALKEYHGKLQTLKPNRNLEIQETLKSLLPSKSLDDFLKLNKLLAASSPHREELVNFVKTRLSIFVKNVVYSRWTVVNVIEKKMYHVVICGETSVKACIRKIMKFTQTYSVESEYSGVGKKFRGVTKLNYSETQTFKCLRDVLIDKLGLIPELKNLGGRVGQWISSNVERESLNKIHADD